MTETLASITSPSRPGFIVRTLGRFNFRWTVSGGQTFSVGRDENGRTWWNAIDGEIIGDTLAWDGSAEEFLLWCLLEGVEAVAVQEYWSDIYAYLDAVQQESEKALCQ